VFNTTLFYVGGQECQTQNNSTQNVRIAHIEETCHNFEAQSRDLAQVKAKCSELDAAVRSLSRNTPRGETSLPG